MARFAVSAVTCRQAEIRMPFSGWFLMNSLRIICSTFMDWFAHSMRFLPSSASSRLLISLLICAAVDIRLLWRFQIPKIVLVTRLLCLREVLIAQSEYTTEQKIQHTHPALKGVAPSAYLPSC